MGPTSSLKVKGSWIEIPTFFDALFNKFLLSNNKDREALPVVYIYICDQFRIFQLLGEAMHEDLDTIRLSICSPTQAKKLGIAIRGDTTTW